MLKNMEPSAVLFTNHEVPSSSEKNNSDFITKYESSWNAGVNSGSLSNHAIIKRKFQQVNDYEKKKGDVVRVMQWNILADALGCGLDNFIKCPKNALKWDFRKVHILNEILQYFPDIVCCQEVDHFYDFMKPSLGQVGYKGVFYKKPWSPCLDVPRNNGPDGCALFYRNDKFELVSSQGVNLLVDTLTTNQVAIMAQLKLKSSKKENSPQILVATTHLKAKAGFEKYRAVEGENLLQHLQPYVKTNIPIILTGDFNATPQESVYGILSNSRSPKLQSAYVDKNNKEPAYTTWCIREQGEFPRTLDYIWYSRDAFKVLTRLEMPNSCDIPQSRLPCYQYPSDHLSLICDLQLN